MHYLSRTEQLSCLSLESPTSDRLFSDLPTSSHCGAGVGKSREPGTSVVLPPFSEGALSHPANAPAVPVQQEDLEALLQPPTTRRNSGSTKKKQRPAQQEPEAEQCFAQPDDW